MGIFRGYRWFGMLLAVGMGFVCVAGAEGAEPAAAPIKAAFFTGGCCHDYKTLVPLLTHGMARYANVRFTVQEGMKPFEDPKFADDFDVIVMDQCFDEKGNQKLADNISHAVRAGKPAVFIHCAMHTLRETDYYKCLGLHTVQHDPFRSFKTKRVDPESPITRFWPDAWTTPGDELYQNLEFPATSHALLTAYSKTSKKDHVVAWTHTFGKGRVFGTTLGHDVKTADQPVYLHLLANGLLWAVDKLGPDGKPAAGYEGRPEDASASKGDEKPNAAK